MKLKHNTNKTIYCPKCSSDTIIYWVNEKYWQCNNCSNKWYSTTYITTVTYSKLIKTIQKILEIDDITKNTRKSPYPLARHLLCYFLKKMTNLSNREIGKSINYVPSNVYHSRKHIENLLETDEITKILCNSIKLKLET